MALNLHHLCVFHAVARYGNVTMAANALMISQPAVSKQVKLLEQSLGVRLIERTRRGVAVTEAGQMLAGYAAKIVSLSDQAEAAVADLQSLRRGRLTVAASPTIGTYLLPRVLVRFRLKYPGIQLNIEIAQSSSLFRRLADDDPIDVALTEVEPPDDRFDFRVFMRDAFCPIAAHGHPLARKRSVSIAQFAEAGLILHESASPGGSFVEQILRQERVDVRPVLRLNSTEAIKEAVAAGLGVAIVSGLAVRTDLAVKRLAMVSLKGLTIRRSMYQVTRPASAKSKPGIAFLYMLKHVARGTLPGLDRPVTPAV